MSAHGVDERDVRLVDADAPLSDAALGEHRSEDVLHEAVDELGLLHDRDGVRLSDPRHAKGRLVDFAARCEQHRIGARHQECAVERRRLAGDELSPEAGEVADVLVLPQQEEVDVRVGERPVGVGHPSGSEGRHVVAVLPVDCEGTLGVPAHSVSSRDSCSACQTRWGVSGMSRCLTPWRDSTSITALWIAGVEPRVPDSPMPLAPIGLYEVRVVER